MNWKIRYDKESNSDKCFHWKFYNVCLYPYFIHDDYEETHRKCNQEDCPIKIEHQ